MKRILAKYAACILVVLGIVNAMQALVALFRLLGAFDAFDVSRWEAAQDLSFYLSFSAGCFYFSHRLLRIRP